MPNSIIVFLLEIGSIAKRRHENNNNNKRRFKSTCFEWISTSILSTNIVIILMCVNIKRNIDLRRSKRGSPLGLPTFKKKVELFFIFTIVILQNIHGYNQYHPHIWVTVGKTVPSTYSSQNWQASAWGIIHTSRLELNWQLAVPSINVKSLSTSKKSEINILFNKHYYVNIVKLFLWWNI